MKKGELLYMVSSKPWETRMEKLDKSEREVNDKKYPPHEDLYETNVGMKIFSDASVMN